MTSAFPFPQRHSVSKLHVYIKQRLHTDHLRVASDGPGCDNVLHHLTILNGPVFLVCFVCFVLVVVFVC